MIEPEESSRDTRKEDWNKFLDRYAGCLADTPIERGDQGNFEQREELVECTY